MSKLPKITWSQRKATLSLFVACAGESGEPELKLASDEELFITWGAFKFEAPFTEKVDHASAEWVVGKLTKKGMLEVTLRKAKSGPYWNMPFGGGKRANVAPNWDTWIDEDEEVDESAAVPPPPPPPPPEDPNGIPKRKKGGWKPTQQDWDRVVAENKPLTDDLSGRKIALSFSSKSADAKFAKELEKTLNAEGAECKAIVKWPVATWVQLCVFAADQADFTVIVHSANYEAGNFSEAELFLLKEANARFVQLNIDDPHDVWHVKDTEEAIKHIRRSLALNQKLRVQNNFDPITFGYNSMDGEAKKAFSQIQKSGWTKKEATTEVFVTMGSQVGVATDSGPKKAENAELAELRKMLSAGPPSQRPGATR